MFRDAINASGNYGEVWDRNAQPVLPRDSVAFNRLNGGSTGQMMTLKFGEIANDRGDVPLSDAMMTILNRGKLRCGVRTGRAGFATVSQGQHEGIEVDLCRAISAALFQGSTEHIEFVSFLEQSDGFQLLASDLVDVIGGVTSGQLGQGAYDWPWLFFLISILLWIQQRGG